ncbi:TonB-dependent siderophore receptor [Pleurocapsa sp. CCALA 161]|uniref:TonB-dependent siderophore receptor n=1 Tax=Pleurocapsa sp. CCALA 161 TaxID=2107688 RepID=UPI000D074687|nr:TonB-dependent siderophore receptor [Pleurocapsa sp. CCALA 161]PSB06722.1 TonB-dependent siderophore receptor [Pleurocapsa sp. CCALA 161]
MKKYRSLLLFLVLFLGSWTIPGLAENKNPEELLSVSRNAQDLLSQAENNTLTRVTRVEFKQTPKGLQLILTTPPGQPKLVPLILPEGNNLVIDLLDATLAFSIRNGVTKTNPASGIKEVRVRKVDATSIRVTIAGAKQVPRAEIVPSRQNLVLSVTPEATAQTQADEEIEIVVTGEREEDNYAVPNATVGTRTDTPIKDVPQSIQVIPRQVIEDQGRTEINEALRNASGITQAGAGQFRIRGFSGQRDIQIDGVGTYAPNQRIDFSLSNVEQIEVLKGPAAVLYGSGEPGGIVNLTTKKPLKEPRYQLEGIVGNFDYYRPSLDITGPLNEEKTILYRLNASYENTGSFVDFLENEEFAVFPVLSFELGKNTTLTIEGGYQEKNNRGGQIQSIEAPALPIEGTIFNNPLGEISRSRNLAEPTNETEFVQSFVGYSLEHKFSDDWNVKNRFRAKFAKLEGKGVGFFGELDEDNRTALRSAGDQLTTDDSYTLQTDVSGKFQTGSVQHQLLVGLELRRETGEDLYQDVVNEEVSSIDVFEPEYGNLPSFENLETTFDSTFETDIIGLYAQDLVSIGDKVKILLGGRFDWTDNSYVDFGESFELDAVTAFSPRLGIVYQPIEPVSLYASYSSFFLPELFSTDAEGNPFEPITGRQFEVGVKTEFFDGRASATLAAFQINRRNDFVTNPDNPDFSIQVGEQRSRGIEFDLTGEVLPGFNLIATYGFTDAEITEDPVFGGFKFAGIARHTGSIWAVYEVLDGGFQGFGVGAGVFVQGEKPGDTENTFDVPAYARTDAVLYYRRENWRAQLNFENLLDTDYFIDGNEEGVTPGAPFTVRGQLSAEF